MELDFSALNALADQPPEEDPRHQPEELDTAKMDRQVNAVAQERKKIAEAYREYQNNIKTAGWTISEIRKGILAGEDIYSLFLKAMDAIGKMTGERDLEEQTRSDLLAVYGIGLQETQPLQMERDRIRQRIARMETALANADPANRSQIERAIRAHRAMLEAKPSQE